MTKNFTQELSARIGRDKKSTLALLEGLQKALAQYCGDEETVAIPGFGTFVPSKHDERISQDELTGRTMLLPPEILLEFQPASKLRKIAERNVDSE
ncbi:MAG: HU family DNA-binding protein [Muribaculaceae bacterium]|nr:HU family DNA-binding protein [Muribaculaceae bacterium]